MADTSPPPGAADDLESDAALAQRIREAREVRQLTQQAVATRSKWADPEGKGISRTALIGYEAGTSRPGARELRILCKTLAVSPNKLLFGTESPVRTAHPALETLDLPARLRHVIELAFVLAALKGHERDALASLALSLAGRQLGDVRLSGLRSLAAMSRDAVAGALRSLFPEGTDVAQLPLEQLMDAASRTVGSTLGTNLLFDFEAGDETEPSRGTWLYPDPDSGSGQGGAAGGGAEHSR